MILFVAGLLFLTNFEGGGGFAQDRADRHNVLHSGRPRQTSALLLAYKESNTSISASKSKPDILRSLVRVITYNERVCKHRALHYPFPKTI